MIRAPGVNALLNSAAVLRQLVSRRNAFEEAVADRRSKARPDKQQRTVWTFGFKGWKIGKGFATFGQKLLSHLFTKKPEVSWSFNISVQGDFWVLTMFICEATSQQLFGFARAVLAIALVIGLSPFTQIFVQSTGGEPSQGGQMPGVVEKGR